MIRQIPLTFDELPVSKILTITGESYEFRFRYNERNDSVTMDIMDSDGLTIYTTRLCYGYNALHAGLETGLFPEIRVVPMTDYDATAEGWSDILLNAENFDSIMLLYDDLT